MEKAGGEMIIHVKVKPKSGKREVESFGDGRYLVYLKEPPENGRANIELLNVLSKFLGTPATRIKIKTGFTSNNKMLEVS
ncbi:DUF167 domain-containing protein [Candidatus Pacearchaeota archaeon]|nr:DUF167 domain-containing protein [Candidatus Pacearchaeota archaeon]